MPRLRRADPSRPGIRRRRAGRGFFYVDPEGERITDEGTLERIDSLVIPPAWEDVWISVHPNAHIQAVGVDARGRRQYRYHEAWRERRDREKFERMLEFGRALPEVRRRTAEHLELPGMPRERVLACAVRLLDLGFFRIGTEEYAEANDTFGLATMRQEHVRIAGNEVVFDYPAKSGKRRVQSVVDAQVLEVVKALKRRRGGGPELLAYKEKRRWHDLRSQDVNAYIKDVSGGDFTAKDFRTWNATVLAAVALAVSSGTARSATARKRAVARCYKEVAGYLGNTPSVCRSSYVDPRVVDRYRSGDTVLDTLADIEPAGDGENGLLPYHGAVEEAVLELLDPDHTTGRAAA